MGLDRVIEIDAENRELENIRSVLLKMAIDGKLARVEV